MEFIWQENFSIYKTYYKFLMEKSDYYFRLMIPIKRGKISFPCTSEIQRKASKTVDEFPAGEVFYIVIKPVKRLIPIRKYLAEMTKLFGISEFRIILVKNMGRYMPQIYKNNSIVSREVAELYFSDKRLKHNNGYIIICKAERNVDLCGVKKYLRKRIGYIFYEISNMATGRKLFVGLNGVHIPDADNMAVESVLFRKIIADE